MPELGSEELRSIRVRMAEMDLRTAFNIEETDKLKNSVRRHEKWLDRLMGGMTVTAIYVGWYVAYHH